VLAKGVIRDCVPWAEARGYFYWRVRRRLAQDAIVDQLKVADTALAHAAGVELLKGWVTAEWEDDKAVLDFFEKEADALTAKIEAFKGEAVSKTVAELLASLSDDARATLIASLK